MDDFSRHEWNHSFPTRMPPLQVTLLWHDGPLAYLGDGYLCYIKEMDEKGGWVEWWVGPVPKSFGEHEVRTISACDLIRRYCTLIAREHGSSPKARVTWRRAKPEDFYADVMPGESYYLFGSQEEHDKIDPIEFMTEKKLKPIERGRLRRGRIAWVKSDMIFKNASLRELENILDSVMEGAVAMQSLDDLGSKEANEAAHERLCTLEARAEAIEERIKEMKDASEDPGNGD